MKLARRLLLTLVILLALALLAFLLVRFFSRADETPPVLLPSPAGNAGVSDGAGEGETLTLAAVTPETVLDVLAALDRADSYSRTLTVETFWDGGADTETIDVYARGGSMRLVSGTRSLLLTDDGAWLWYSDAARVLHSESDLRALADRYSRTLTYEALLSSRPPIAEAYCTDLNGESCIYLEYADGAFHYVNRLYISVVTGLLMQTETFDGESCIYRMVSGAADISTPEDAVFAPPEGDTVSFAGVSPAA